MSKVKIIVSRTDDRVILMIPEQSNELRCHAILYEDEAYCGSNFIRRMIQSRERRDLSLGSEGTGINISRVSHPNSPVEIKFEDDVGTTILDLTKDDAHSIADMLWAAHRAVHTFYAMTTITGGMRQRERQNSAEQIVPVPDDINASNAQLIGSLTRRSKGLPPESKD